MSKKILSVLLALVMVLAIAPVSVFAKDDVLSYLTYEINDGKVTITSCDMSISGDVVIPNKIDGYPVTIIGEGAFADCEALESVTIPKSVTVIEAGAFYCCISLVEANIPNSVTYIGDYAFWLCRLLKSVSISKNVSYIGAGAFSSCESLASIVVDSGNLHYSGSSDGILFNKNKTILVQCPAGSKLTSYSIPKSVTEIAESAFEGCENIASVTISENVKSIGIAAFNSCLALKNITVSKDNKYFSSDSKGVLFDNGKTMLIQYPIKNSGTSYAIPSTVENICYGAFAHAYNLKSVTIPESVKTIGEEAFWECYNMQKITIGSGVKTIEDSAFVYCFSLCDVYYSGSQADWNKITIGERNELNGDYVKIHFGNKSSQDTNKPTTDKPVQGTASDVLAPTAGSNITVKDTVANLAPEMSVSAFIKSVENENVQIVDKNGKAIANNEFVGTGNKVQVLDKNGKVLSEYEVMVKSDVDGNGKITPADARLALRASANLDKIEGVFETAANYDGKDAVSTSDARMILRKAAGLEEK